MIRARYLIVVAVIGFLSFSIYWLWQRQPRSLVQTQKQTTASATLKKSQDEKLRLVSPEDNTFVESGTLLAVGKTAPSSYLVILGEKPEVIETDEDGNFKKEFRVVLGLNLLKVLVISDENVPEKWLTVFSSDANKNFRNVFAGQVKSIFENILTIENIVKDKQIIRLAKTVEMILPSSENKKEEKVESTTSAIDKIRIDDYVIALGEKDGQSLIAHELEIIRDQIPKNNEEFSIFQITSSVNQNTFSAQEQKSQILSEFALNNTSRFSSPQGPRDEKNFTPGDKAIIVYHRKQDAKILDLLYLLPKNVPSQKP